MQLFNPTIVLRHQRENIKKCSLRGLEVRPDFIFYTYPRCVLPPLSQYIILTLDGPPLTKKDASSGLFILDSTWRYVDKMMNFVGKQCLLTQRSIPSHFRTAYPRRQDDCLDPTRGLASIEAIYIAYKLLDRDTLGLLDNYHWKEKFLELNPDIKDN